MAKVTVNLVTENRTFPAGTVGGVYRVSLIDAQGASAFLEGSATDFAFDDVEAGNYTVTAALLDAAGLPLFAAPPKAITVAAATVQLAVPVDFNVTVG
jgi:hypothetical protein